MDGLPKSLNLPNSDLNSSIACNTVNSTTDNQLVTASESNYYKNDDATSEPVSSLSSDIDNIKAQSSLQENQLSNNSRTIPASEVQFSVTPTDTAEQLIETYNKNHQIVQSLLQDQGDESKPIPDSFANANLTYHSEIPVPTLYVSNTSSTNSHLTQEKPKHHKTKPIKVVNASIALLYNEFGQVFVSQRRAGCDYEHSLEFPGGKIELGETPENCIIRELEEEIGVDVLNMEKLCVFIWRNPEREHILHIYKVTDYIGEPYGKEGQEIFWFNIDELDDNRFMPSSQDLISCIRNTNIDLHK